VDHGVLPNMEGMDLQHPQLQLIFNVIAITAVTSLALICSLLKRDKDHLATELNRRRIQRATAPAMQPARAPSASAAPVAAAMDQDIRQFVARRAQSWITPSVSSGARVGSPAK
jgi:hypothetical protein